MIQQLYLLQAIDSIKKILITHCTDTKGSYMKKMANLFFFCEISDLGVAHNTLPCSVRKSPTWFKKISQAVCVRVCACAQVQIALVEHLSTLHEALSSIPSVIKKKVSQAPLFFLF